MEPTFPPDDHLSIHIGSPADCDLSIYYAQTYVEDENVAGVAGTDGCVCRYKLQHAPVAPGSIVGAIIRGGGYASIQTFRDSSEGIASFKDLFLLDYKVVDFACDYRNGEIMLTWNKAPDFSRIIVSYEYDHTSEEYYTPDVPDLSGLPPDKVLSRPDGSLFPKPTFERFFSGPELLSIVENAGTVSIIDYQSILGCTILEKYESLYVKIMELTDVLIKKGAAGYFWIAASTEVASIFECATKGFRPSDSGDLKDMCIDGQQPMGLSTDACTYAGLVNGKWRLYKHSALASNYVVIGCNDVKEKREHYARLNICNLFI